jgi:hypothetical protein
VSGALGAVSGTMMITALYALVMVSIVALLLDDIIHTWS